jgi:hypothetical protein
MTVTVDQSTILAFTCAVAGIAATWGALRGKIAALEAKAKALEQVTTSLKEVCAAADATIAFVRTDQGRRLGELEKTVNGLVGRFDGFEKGFGAGRRSRTAAQGHKVNDDHG